MDVAPLDLCMQLYELTGWDSTGRSWHDMAAWSFEPSDHAVIADRYTEGASTIRLSPAYDLCFLLRKWEDNDSGDDFSLRFVRAQRSGTMRWIARHRGCAKVSDSPVESMAALIIELITTHAWRNAPLEVCPG
ncbi:MAG: hypothetical protein ABIR68_03130 [Ilumatobacteraceae bacterium]